MDVTSTITTEFVLPGVYFEKTGPYEVWSRDFTVLTHLNENILKACRTENWNN